MEIIHSTNIVFDSQNGRESSNEAMETFRMNKPFRKMKSPKGSRLPKPSRSPFAGNGGLAPIKGQPLESPVRSSAFSVLPPTPTFESPKQSESPLKGGGSYVATHESMSPVKDRKRTSPADSGVELPRVLTLDSYFSVSPSKINPKVSYWDSTVKFRY